MHVYPIIIIFLIFLLVWLILSRSGALDENKRLRAEIAQKSKYIMIQCDLHSKKGLRYGANVLLNTETGELSPPIEQKDRMIYLLPTDSSTDCILGAPKYKPFGFSHRGGFDIKMLGALYIFDPEDQPAHVRHEEDEEGHDV